MDIAYIAELHKGTPELIHHVVKQMDLENQADLKSLGQSYYNNMRDRLSERQAFFARSCDRLIDGIPCSGGKMVPVFEKYPLYGERISVLCQKCGYCEVFC